MKGTVCSSTLPGIVSFFSSTSSWVVQDLREECIKLKKRVFDLERQNQMLSSLFQQKLQLTTGSLPQVGISHSPPLVTPQFPASPSPIIISTHFPPKHLQKQAVQCSLHSGGSPPREGPPGLIGLQLRWGENSLSPLKPGYPPPCRCFPPRWMGSLLVDREGSCLLSPCVGRWVEAELVIISRSPGAPLATALPLLGQGQGWDRVEGTQRLVSRRGQERHLTG